MIDPKKFQQVIDDLAKKLAEAIPSSVQNVTQDIQHTFRSILQSTFAKLDLVTREEFDVQAQVLTKTRAKLDALELTVAELEKRSNIHKPDINAREND